MEEIVKKTKKSEEKKLTSQQQKALKMLAYQAMTQKEVAEEVRVAESTLSEWINNNDLFIKEYNKAVDLANSYTLKQFKSKVSQAAKTIFDLSQNAENETVRLNAAKEIIYIANKDITLDDKVKKQQISASKANEELTKEKTKLIKGATPDLSMQQAILDVIKDD